MVVFFDFAQLLFISNILLLEQLIPVPTGSRCKKLKNRFLSIQISTGVCHTLNFLFGPAQTKIDLLLYPKSCHFFAICNRTGKICTSKRPLFLLYMTSIYKARIFTPPLLKCTSCELRVRI